MSAVRPLTALNERNETNGWVQKKKKKNRHPEKGGIEFRERAEYFRLVKQNEDTWERTTATTATTSQARQIHGKCDTFYYFVWTVVVFNFNTFASSENMCRKISSERRARDRKTTMSVYCLPPALHQFSCYLVLFFLYIYFRVGFSFCSAANRQKASPSFGYKLWQLAKTYLWHNKIFACAIKNKFVCVCVRESDSAASQCCAVFGVRMRLRMAQVIRHKIEIFSPPAKCEK